MIPVEGNVLLPVALVTLGLVVSTTCENDREMDHHLELITIRE